LQREVIQSIQRRARKDSLAARKHVLSLLGSAAFEAALDGCCPELLAMSAEARLRWYDQEMLAVEMVHNFGEDGSGGIQSDETVELGANATFFYNMWEVGLLGAELQRPPVPFNCSNPMGLRVCGPHGSCHPAPEAPRGFVCHCHTGWLGDMCSVRVLPNCTTLLSRPTCENISSFDASGGFGLPPCKWVAAHGMCVQLATERPGHGPLTISDVAEVNVFGFPAFKVRGDPNAVPYAEAVQRPIYTAVNTRKVDVGNPTFGPVSAIFAPGFVRNMTLIAPIDTGAWEGECNKSLDGGANAALHADDPGLCNGFRDAAACDNKAPDACDWRRPAASGALRCVNSVLDRMQCAYAPTEAACAVTRGLPPPDERSLATVAPDRSSWWKQVLYNGGCSWNPSAGRCGPFVCATQATMPACHAVNNATGGIPPPLPCNHGISGSCGAPQTLGPRHCMWDAGGKRCVKATQAEYCRRTSMPPGGADPIGPSSNGTKKPSQRSCDDGIASFLCRWANASHCVPLVCAQITNVTKCAGQPSTQSQLCAWLPETGRCVEYAGNCSRLPTATACGGAKSCHWDAKANNCTTKAESGPTGSSFNCSSNAWFGQNGTELALGTPTDYYHTLAAGVTVWSPPGTGPAEQLGQLFQRMARPTTTIISSADVFRCNQCPEHVSRIWNPIVCKGGGHNST
jgi:hypothetical protein